MIFVTSAAKMMSYEVFLQMHQLFSLIFLCGTAWHLLSISHLSSLPFCVYLALVGPLNLFIFLRILYRNKSLGSPWPRAFLSRVEGLNSVVHMRLRTSKHLDLKPGQYMNIWLPRVQFWSTHPFTIASSTWNPSTGQMELDFFIHTKKGFTRRLFQSCPESAIVERLVLFSGPHGTPVRHTSANTIIMIATGMGIWPMSTYVEDIIRTNRSQSATSRIILVYITQKLCV